MIELVDALGLGVYGMVGAQKSLAAGLPLVSVALVGCVNAVGGGVLRDVVREEPLIFKPGEFYALAALAGVLAFIGLAAGCPAAGALRAGGDSGVSRSWYASSPIRLGWPSVPSSPRTGGPPSAACFALPRFDERSLGCSQSRQAIDPFAYSPRAWPIRASNPRYTSGARMNAFRIVVLTLATALPCSRRSRPAATTPSGAPAATPSTPRRARSSSPSARTSRS